MSPPGRNATAQGRISPVATGTNRNGCSREACLCISAAPPSHASSNRTDSMSGTTGRRNGINLTEYFFDNVMIA